MTDERHGGVFASMPPSSGEPEWLKPAIEMGHHFRPDPRGFSVSEIRERLERDSALLSDANRFTCRSCGDAALMPRGFAYGTAFERACKEVES